MKRTRWAWPLVLAACTWPATEASIPRDSLPAPTLTTWAPTARTTLSQTTTTTTSPVGRRLLAPGWELVGEGDRIGGLIFGTGEELIVWGGREFPQGLEDGPYLHNGRAWHHERRTSRLLPPAPFEDCRGTNGSVWTGVEIVVWFRAYADPGCSEGAVGAYNPETDSWREINAPQFAGAGTWAVWTGSEVLAWKAGLALDPNTGAVRPVASLEINEGSHSRVHAHWAGDELLVTGGAQLHRYRPETNRWEELESPPIGITAQASAWTGDRLLAVNYAMEATLFDPAREEWTTIESMPLRFWETIPQTFASDALTMVRMGSSFGVLDGITWVAVPDPVMTWDYQYPHGQAVIADGWLYQVGNVVLRRHVPQVAGGGFQTESRIPLQTLLFDIPEGWIVRLLPGGSEGHAHFEATGDNARCVIDAMHSGEPPVTTDEVTLIRSWDGGEMHVGVNLDTHMAVVDDVDRSSDWVAFRCNSNEAAQSLASHVWVRPD